MKFRQKFLNSSAQKFGGPKTSKFRRFCDLIAKSSEAPQDVVKWKTALQTPIYLALVRVLHWVNFGLQTAKNRTGVSTHPNAAITLGFATHSANMRNHYSQ